MDKIKAGVIGIGTMGYGYTRIIDRLRDVELVGIVDTNEVVLERVSKEFGVEGYREGEEFFQKENPDFVIVSCPDEYHVDYSLMALERNINVHLEKPVSNTLEGCNKILMASKRSKAKLNVGYILRVLPQYISIRRRFRSGTFGKLIHFYTRRNMNIDEGLRWKGETDLPTCFVCHDVDILMWITGLKIERVYAEETIRSLKKYNTHDSVQVILKVSDGSIGVIECSWALPKSCNFNIDNRFELIGTKEAAFINLKDQGIDYYSENGIVWEDMIFSPELQDGFIDGALKNEIDVFLEAILNGKPVMCSVEEGIDAFKVALASKISLKKNKVVYVKDVK